MIRLIVIAALVGMPAAASAADDFRVHQLEQDVRDLQRQVQALSRQIESQRAAPPAPDAAIRQRDAASGLPPHSPPPGAPAPAWVDAAKWQRVQPGMTELEVIGILGPPTSMRTEESARVFLYALEIGSSGFLVGSVRLRNSSVVSVQKPTLQ
jgi:outer membrane murein-binding lipoprotein Lpp